MRNIESPESDAIAHPRPGAKVFFFFFSKEMPLEGRRGTRGPGVQGIFKGEGEFQREALGIQFALPEARF